MPGGCDIPARRTFGRAGFGQVRPLGRVPLVRRQPGRRDGNFDFDVFVRDRTAGTTVRASVRTDGTEGGLSLGSQNPSMSGNGLVIAFESEADLVPADTGFPVDVFTHAH